MGAWFLGAREQKDIREVHEIMRSDPIEAADVGKDTIIAYLSAGGRWRAPAEAITHESIWFDGGGMVRFTEPKLAWEANGCKMATFVRHLPFLIDAFRTAEPRSKYHGMIVMSGFARTYVLAPLTGDTALPVMEGLLKGTESLRQELELDTQKVMNDSPHGASYRKCGCLSGLLYVECCGKFVESEQHRATRNDLKGMRNEERY